MNSSPTTPKFGPILMVVGAMGFFGYAVVFFILTLVGSGFELGVDTLNGMTRGQLDALNPAIIHYMTHIHVALSGFIASTAILLACVAWFSVRRKDWWGWLVAVGAPVLALAVALPLHYTGGFQLDWTTHLLPVYIGTLIYVAGALLALKSLMA